VAARTRDRWRALERRALAALAAGTVALLVVAFYYPVGTVLVEAGFVDGRPTLAPFVGVLTDPLYVDILWFTAYQAALSTVASVALGLPAAFLLARFEFPGRRTLRSLTVVPFVLPSILVAVGFVATFGREGPLNAALVAVGLGPIELLYTLPAIVVAHAFYNAPLVARVTTAAWESVDAAAVETARSLGAGRFRAFRDVVAPQLLPAVLTGAALTFVFTFGSFAIVLAVGGLQLATVEVFVYRLVRNFQYAEAASLAVVELVVSLGLLYGYLRIEARYDADTRGARPPERAPLVPAAWTPRATLVRAGLVAYAAVAVVVFVGPLASLVLASVTGPTGFTLEHYRFLLARQTTGAAYQVRPLPAVLNSLAFAAASLAVALPMGVVVAVLTTREYRGRSVVGAVAMAPLAVSGIVVGLGLLRGLVFGVEVGGVRLAAGGAAAIVAAHAVAGYPFVVRTVAPALQGLDDALVESARALGAPRARALLDVELPLVWPAVVAGAAFAVAISIGEFSATVVLASGSGWYTMPVAIERFVGRRLGPATAMGVVLLVVTASAFVVVDRLGGDDVGV
jgi:thiamine transport system permease protein